MKSLKIKLNSESEAEEVKRLAVKAGYTLDDLFSKWSAEFCYLVLCEDMSAGFGNEIMADGDKPLSIGELRDMVVLNRNDHADANVEEENCLYDLYLTKAGDLYFYHCGKNRWILSNISGDESYYKSLKPIEKTMKEYLEPLRYGGYKYHKDPDAYLSTWLEIHKDAEFAVLNGNDEVDFYTGSALEKSHFISESIVWQREQDEPFLTPECTLNDQYAEIEQVRQVEIRGTVKAAQASGGVDATLSQRQSQYGCYEDVAHVTQQILSALRIGNYDELPAPMKESLHMIASKMARIVNGDPEYLDNWHDIGGYAKLIEKLIEGN